MLDSVTTTTTTHKTVTATVYKRDELERRNSGSLPSYAKSACSNNWNTFKDACKCLGFKPTTTTTYKSVSPLQPSHINSKYLS